MADNARHINPRINPPERRTRQKRRFRVDRELDCHHWLSSKCGLLYLTVRLAVSFNPKSAIIDPLSSVIEVNRRLTLRRPYTAHYLSSILPNRSTLIHHLISSALS